MATDSIIPRTIHFNPHQYQHHQQHSSCHNNSSPNSCSFFDSSITSTPATAHRSESISISYNMYKNTTKNDVFADHHIIISMPSLPLPRIGSGLSNMGNTCFLNSVLQCLTYTPPLTHYLLDGLHKRTCKVAGFCAMCALEHHVKEVLKSPERIISPTSLVKNLTCISRSFRMWRQEDAHEYMRYLIEALRNCSSIELPIGETFIQSVFGGQLRSQVKCAQCSHCSNTYDPFLDLSLEVVRADSLHKAFNHFTAVEVLDGDNRYQCSKCNKKVRALKQFTIDTAPQVLTVHFKRFSSSGKIDKKIQFDRTLDLKPFVSGGEDKDLKYSLFAVLVHSGRSTSSGHYYCFVRTLKNMWHLMDDSRVSEVSERTVLEQKAYILFYVRNTKAMETQNMNPSHRTISCSRTNAIQLDGYLNEYEVQETHLFELDKGEMMDKSELSSTFVNKALATEVVDNVEVMDEGSCIKSSTTSEDDNSELKHASIGINKVSKPEIDDNKCSKKEDSLSSDTVTTAPKLRHTFFESASQYVLHILNACEKFCLSSCFWPAAE